MPYLLRFLVFVLLTGAVCACQKEEVPPQTGNLLLRVNYGGNLSRAPYYLFTEQVWASGRSATPLREGALPALAATAITGNAVVELKDLNAGNYIFVLGSSSSSSWSVQVTAGKTTEFTR